MEEFIAGDSYFTFVHLVSAVLGFHFDYSNDGRFVQVNQGVKLCSLV
jgi:hypothetical protein